MLDDFVFEYDVDMLRTFPVKWMLKTDEGLRFTGVSETGDQAHEDAIRKYKRWKKTHKKLRQIKRRYGG